MIRYSEKIFDFSETVVARIWDRRECPCIPTPVIVRSAVALFWARLGSLNALETVATASLWKKWLGQSMPSADTIGRVCALTDLDGLREGIHRVCERLKRNKALPDIGGLGVAVLDGHESHASYLRHCSDCLQRTISTKHGDRTQYNHRNVTLNSTQGRPDSPRDLRPNNTGLSPPPLRTFPLPGPHPVGSRVPRPSQIAPETHFPARQLPRNAHPNLFNSTARTKLTLFQHFTADSETACGIAKSQLSP